MSTRLIVEIRFKAPALHRAVLEPGQVLRVGRGEQAGLVVASDPHLSALHFELVWNGMTCLLRDLDSATGTLLDGRRITKEAQIHHGAWVRAGTTDLSVYFEGATPPAEPLTPERVQLASRLLEVLEVESLPLLAVLDAARSERVRVLLRESVEFSKSLYEGPQAEVLAEVAPYLVSLPREGRLLHALLAEGWGKSWGIYLACAQPFAEVRRHLRKLLMVEGATGQELYFRFYDPRVLRPFLRTSSASLVREVLGPIDCFWLQGEQPEQILRIHYTPEGGREASPRLPPRT
ncbi:FHA domain-containing protein [Cystobacter fuscus]|uniref:FHA domain-containing protein n=1 Tax=Cystobacter fuscus TaxID=43 RepID=A0A250JE62_9BACT|nr:DUF4123 domain-containing protein [Cystobacter fuscus]ATB41782.1 FHA domain-containing protein [Cystobacter fuscus]